MVALRIHHGEIQRNNLAVNDLAPHIVHCGVEPLALPVERPSGGGEKLEGTVDIHLIDGEVIQIQILPGLDHLLILGICARNPVRKAGNIGIFIAVRHDNGEIHLTVDRQILPLAYAVVSVHPEAEGTAVVLGELVSVHAPGDGLTDRLIVDSGPLIGEGEEGEADARLILEAEGIVSGSLHQLLNHGAIGDLVHQVELTALQLLHHGVIIRQSELDFLNVPGIILIDNNLDGLWFLLLFFSRFVFGLFFVLIGLDDLGDDDGLALIVRIQLKVGGHAVIGRDHIRAGDHGGMAVIARLGVQNSLPEQLGRKAGLGGIGVVIIADEAAGAVVIDPAARSNNVNRIRHAEQQADFEEVREEVAVERDVECKVIRNLHTFQVSHLAAEEPVITQDVLGTVDLAADLLNLR